MIKILVRTAALAAIAGAILAGVIIKGRSREDAYARESNRSVWETYTEENPLTILEIVPYVGQGQWGYLVGGQEPVKRSKFVKTESEDTSTEIYEEVYDLGDINQYYYHPDLSGTGLENASEDDKQKFYKQRRIDGNYLWGITSDTSVTGNPSSTALKFEAEFHPTALLQNSGENYYTNPDKFIYKVILDNGYDNHTAEEWRKRIKVKTVSAYQLDQEDIREIEDADLVVIQSDKTSNFPDHTSGYKSTMLQIYDKYRSKGEDTFYSDAEARNQLLPANTGTDFQNFITYESYISHKGGKAVSMDISWDVAMAIADRALEHNKATIVSSNDQGEYANSNITGNMNKLIFLLTFFSQGAYSSSGDNVRDLIKSGYDANGKLTGFIDGKDVWTVSAIKSYLFGESGYLLNFYAFGNYVNFLKYYERPADSEQNALMESFFKSVDESYKYYDDMDGFYALISTEEWDAVIRQAEYLQSISRITEQQVEQIKWCREKYEKHMIQKEGNLPSSNYNVFTGSYFCDTEVDNTIRYCYAVTQMPFLPVRFGEDGNEKMQDIADILGFHKKLDSQTGKIKVLEIEPSTDFRYNSIHEEYGPNVRSASDASLTELAHYFGSNWTKDNVEVDSVTPDQLNGMTVDLAAEYDAIFIGEEIGMLSDDIKSSYSSDPYHRVGEKVPSSALINGLLTSDVTTPAGFTSVFYQYHPVLSNLKEKNSFLKNTALYQELNVATEGYPTARYSGNDITLYMKSQLVEFINSGQPVLLSEKVYDRTRNITSSSRTKVNLYDAFEEKGNAENVLKATSTLNTAEKYLVLKPTLKITYSDSGNILELGKQPDKTTTITRSNDLVFSYKGELPANGDYEMLVILDCNGDGIFDENTQNDTSGPTDEEPLDSAGASSQTKNTASTETDADTNKVSDRLLYQGNIIEDEYQGSFNPLHVFQSGVVVDEVTQFRVIVREKNNKYPRTVWTGLMFPEIAEPTQAIRILQVTPDASGSDTRLLKKNGALNAQFSEILKEIDTDKRDYLITADHITVMETTEFNELTLSKDSDNDELNPLDSYDLIIMGFGYGQEDSDIGDQAMACLQKYIAEGKPVLFCSDTVSYVNQPKDNYYTIMKEIQQDNTVTYSVVPVADMDKAMFPEKIWWNYNFTQKMRILLGMDRYYITDGDTKNVARDPVSTDAAIREKQGFSNAVLMDPAFKDRASRIGAAPARLSTSVIQKLNEGAVHIYPFDLTNAYSHERLSIRSDVHAPYYQLDLERSTDQDDVTVWATLGGYASRDGSYSYFDATARDARNNYYLYSKNNIYYTAYELPLDSKNELTEGEKNEMKLFVNTIYAALKSKTKEDTVTTVPIVVAKEGAEISLYDKARAVSNLSNPAYTPNVYTCYYDTALLTEESDDTGTSTTSYLEIPFRVQKVGGDGGETVPLVIGLTGNTYPFTGIPTIAAAAVWAPLEHNTVRTGFAVNGSGTENTKVDFSAFPVIRVQEEQNEDLPGSNAVPVTDSADGSSDTVSAAATWYTLKIPGTEASNLDGKTLLIAVRSGDTGTITPEENSVYAAIIFVERELFELD
jgi:hypothetical protein